MTFNPRSCLALSLPGVLIAGACTVAYLDRVICPDETMTIESAPTQERVVQVEIHVKKCGWMSPWPMEIRLVERVWPFLTSSQEILNLPHYDKEIKVVWLDEDHLQVHYRHCRELSDVVREWRGVRVTYDYSFEAQRGSCFP